MDINKADYFTISQFGNLEYLLDKLRSEHQDIEEVVNLIDKNGISLLQRSLISRKFDISNFLLDNNAKVNIVSNDGYNELSYLAANINITGAVELAIRLLNREVDLNLKDKKFGNSAMFSLCQEVFKKRTEKGNDLIIKCLKKRPKMSGSNKSNDSLKQLIEERGTDEMKKVMEEII